MREYADCDGLGLAALVRDGAVSPLELVEAAIARIERDDPIVNAITYRAFDEARASAAAPLPHGPFAGVPFLVKDFGIDVRGWPHTSGSRFHADVRDGADSGLMRRYRSSGAIPLGRAASSEFGVIGNVETVAYGAVRNPWNLDHAAGGSSGGSAAAVAAGYVPIAHASDGLGSIRIPASFCGLVGLKPTRDRNPNLPDGFDYAMGFCVDHILSRTVRDSAAMLDVTGHPEPGAPYSPPARTGSYLDAVAEKPEPLRILCSMRAPNGADLHPEISAAVTRTAHRLEALGHHVILRELALDHGALQAARAPVSLANFAAGMARAVARAGREPRDGELEPFTRAVLDRARLVTGEAAFHGLQELRMLARTVVAQFEDFDVYLSPVATEPPPPIGELTGLREDVPYLAERQAALFPYPGIFNITGQPSISLPLEMSSTGLPIGIMFTGRYADEVTLFRLAGQLERAYGWPDRRAALDRRLRGGARLS